MIRARVVVVPLVLFGPPAGFFASAEISDALDARETRRHEREYEERIRPAVEALRAVRVDGLTPCLRLKPAEVACLTGNAEVRATHEAFTRAVRAAGATDLSHSCRDAKSRTAPGVTHVACFGSATLHGSEVSYMTAREIVGGRETETLRVTMSAFAPTPE